MVNARKVAFLIVSAALLMFSNAAAQMVTGTILGVVKDTSGAVIPSATVKISNVETGFSRAVVTNSSGNYVATYLPLGTYTVSCEVKGFKKTSIAGVALHVNEQVTVNLQLQVGATTQTVQVTGGVPLIQLSSSQVAATVQSTEVTGLPLNGRDFVQLTRLVPGVNGGIPGANIDGKSSLSWRGSASFSANGARTRDNNFILDGISDNGLLLSSVIVFPTVDAIREFQVLTNTYSAEFGDAQGGVVSIQLKSGTNHWHGDAFEFLRNDKLDANDFFNDQSGVKKPPFRQNQFGFTMGGPIVHNKTFVFGDYQGMRVREGLTFLSTVPTAQMRNGDFSGLNRTIYNPFTGQPFSGNSIPSTMINPAAKNIVGLYPSPNLPGVVGATGQSVNNFLYNPDLVRNDDQFDVRVDQNISDKDQAFASYSFERSLQFQPASLPHGDAGVTLGAGNSLIRAQLLALNETHDFSPTLLNEFRFGFSRFAIKGTPIDNGTNLAQKVGIPGVNISNLAAALPQIEFSPRDIQNIGANPNQPLLMFMNNFQLTDGLTKIKGPHTFKMGFTLMKQQRNLLNVPSPNGVFTFSSNLTSNCAGTSSGCTINPNTGFSVASFLLGLPISEDRQLLPGIPGERRPVFGAYFQDDYHVVPKLTLNLGIRYDYMPPYVEVYNRQSNFDPCTAEFVVASDNAKICGNVVGRRLENTPTKDFSPRIGFAYNLFGNGHTVLRGGYGIFWDDPLVGGSSRKTLNPPFSQAQAFNTTLIPSLDLSAGLPPPPPIVQQNVIGQGSTNAAFDPNFRDSYMQQWNFNIQNAFGRNWMLQLAYVGSKATHLELKRNVNQAPAVVGVTNSNVNRPYISLAPALRNVNTNESVGNSSYNAFEVELRKTYSRNLSMIFSYTFSKSIDDVSDNEGSVFNPYNIAGFDRAVSNFDTTHRISWSWVYGLPFGKGERFASNSGKFVDHLVSGWKANGIVTLQTGLPFGVSQQQGLLSTGTGNRPNRVCSGSLGSARTLADDFKLSCFQQTLDNTGTYGNTGRNILRGRGIYGADLALIKDTKIGERFNYQIRAEFFNAFNTPHFGDPGSTIGTAGAGIISGLIYNMPMRQIQIAMKLEW